MVAHRQGIKPLFAYRLRPQIANDIRIFNYLRCRDEKCINSPLYNIPGFWYRRNDKIDSYNGLACRALHIYMYTLWCIRACYRSESDLDEIRMYFFFHVIDYIIIEQLLIMER